MIRLITTTGEKRWIYLTYLPVDGSLPTPVVLSYLLLLIDDFIGGLSPSDY